MNRINIGRRIEFYRERVGMSTQELATRICRSQATVSRIENGKQGLTFELLALVAAELGVHPFALLSDDAYGPDYSPSSEAERGRGGTLLGNALRTGRHAQRLGLGQAAARLGAAEREVEEVESGADAPDETFLRRLCDVYGLELREMSALLALGAAFPTVDKVLASMQQTLSRIRRVVKEAVPGGEKGAVEHIATLLGSFDSGYASPAGVLMPQKDLFMDQLSHKLGTVLLNKELLFKLLTLAETGRSDAKADRSEQNIPPAT